MAIISSKEMMLNAYRDKYAIGAFNVNNMEIIQGIMDAALEQRSPLILQVSAGARKYAKPAYLMNWWKQPSWTQDWMSCFIWITAKISKSANLVWMTDFPLS